MLNERDARVALVENIRMLCLHRNAQIVVLVISTVTMVDLNVQDVLQVDLML